MLHGQVGAGPHAFKLTLLLAAVVGSVTLTSFVLSTTVLDADRPGRELRSRGSGALPEQVAKESWPACCGRGPGGHESRPLGC